MGTSHGSTENKQKVGGHSKSKLGLGNKTKDLPRVLFSG